MLTSTDLRLAPQALVRSELDAHLEPIVDLPSGRQVGVEVLLRPRRFGSLAGWRRSIAQVRRVELPMLALEVAARALSSTVGRVHVNVTALDLRDEAVVAAVRTTIPAGLHDRLVLEVTEEHRLHDGADLRRGLAQLRRLGVRLAVDDFGEGWSNFSSVQLLRPELIKVTGAVVGPVLAPDLAPAIVELAGRIGAETVYERVEDESTRAWAAAAGFDLGQGWRWPAVPVPTAESRGVSP